VTPSLTAAEHLSKINPNYVPRLALTVWLSISRDSARFPSAKRIRLGL